ncbi:LysR family transcriptional regulator [Marinivivus vitaminiproducens]|uniref:LysR family transcriptional regulator n=1 Tax=Marinivivus vitaminiproducens TaxID=3035935 RepID=UPI00279B3D4B|nr:LysR family transcriptional regulator [Geminicoccaceae bacterium SCSIO 64248]
MDVRQFRYFVTVVELGSFSAAARYLGIAQPALSRHVRSLEERLGAVLLRRDVRGVQATEHGERLLHHASAILRQFDMTNDVVAGNEDTVSGRCVVGLPTSVNAVLAQPLIRASLARLPSVQLHVIESLSGFLQEWVEAGRLDICVLYDARPGRALDLDALLVENLCLVGRTGSFHDAAQDVRFQDIAHYPLAMPGAPHSLRRLLETMALSHGLCLNVVVEVDSLAVMKAITEHDGVFTLLPKGAVFSEVAAGRLEARLITAPIVSRSVSIATSAIRGRTQACEAVKRLIFEIAKELTRTGVWDPEGTLTGTARHAGAGASR